MLSVPERKPPTKIFSKKELKRSRIDRKHRRGYKLETTEDMGTHYLKSTVSFPKDLEPVTTPIPKERSKHYQPIHLGNQINIIHYTDSGHIFCYKAKGRAFIDKMEDHDLMKIVFDILKYYDSISIDYGTGRLTLRKEPAKYIRQIYRKEFKYR